MHKRTIAVALMGSAVFATGAMTVFEPAAAQELIGRIAATVTCSSSSPCAAWQNKGSGPAIQGNASGSNAIKGYTTGTAKAGVYGETDASGGGYGVHGVNSNSKGTAVLASGGAGVGINATSTGLQAVLGSSTAGGVTDGILGTTGNGGFGVRGTSSDAAEGGVGGYATTGFGVIAASTSGIGIDAYSTSGVGAYVSSQNRDGIFAYSDGAGGNGDGASGADIASYGTSNEQYHADGMHVYAATGNGAVISSGSYTATGIEDFTSDLGQKAGAIIGGPYLGVIATTGEGTSSIPLEAGAATPSGTGTGFFYVDGSGNIHYTGTLQSYARTRSGGNASAFEAKTTRSEVEDSGTAQLVGGSAVVSLDPAYAQAIDLSSPYRVFLTPNGDTRGLYIAQKTATTFVVRETQGGHGTLPFDYRILAAAAGHAGERMAIVTPALQHQLFPMLTSRGTLKAGPHMPQLAPTLKPADPFYRRTPALR